MQVILFHPIICFHHINFKSKKGFLGPLLTNGMQALIGNQRIVRDQPTGDKSTLLLRHHLRKKHLQSICQDFGGDLVEDVAQANGSKVL
jgi:hypothetical protein